LAHGERKADGIKDIGKFRFRHDAARIP